MSTSSSISVKHPDGTFHSVYCHNDGYTDGVGKMLVENYNTFELASELVALGDISSLGASIEKPEGHSFDSRADGYTVFYGRDRGEDGVDAEVFDSYDEVDYFYSSPEYSYLFTDGNWVVYRPGHEPRLVLEVLAEMSGK
jgi:hypothetical protein